MQEFERLQNLAAIVKYGDTVTPRTYLGRRSTTTQGPEWDGEDLVVRFVLNSLWWEWGGYEWTSHLRFPGKEWRTASHYCSWYGISCNDASEVVGLHLESNNLQGTIPEKIGGLTDMVDLHLGYNTDLTGTLPQSISKLIKLNYLSIPFTGITGAPPDLRALTSLLYMDATHMSNFHYPADLKDKEHKTSLIAQQWVALHKQGQLTNLTGWDPWCYNGGSPFQLDCPAYELAVGTYWAQMHLKLQLDPWTTRGRYGTIDKGCRGLWCTDMVPGRETGPDLTMGTEQDSRPRAPYMDTVRSVKWNYETDLDQIMADPNHVPQSMDPGLGDPNPDAYNIEYGKVYP